MCYKVKWLNKNQHLKDIFVERTLHFFFFNLCLEMYIVYKGENDSW